MAKGFHTNGDIITTTRDGQNLAQLWTDFQSALADFNAARQPLIDLLSVQVNQPIVETAIPGTERFEEASEFGVPKAIRAQLPTVARGYPFKWYDMGARYTWQFLSKASQQQLDQVLNMAMEADNALQFELIMKALFNSANRSTVITGLPYDVVALYNGQGVQNIPNYQGNTFADSHTHYVTSGAATLDSRDLEDAANLVKEHGFTQAAGYNIIYLMNPVDAEVVTTFRRGVVNNNGVAATWDFIPSTGQGFLLPPGWSINGEPQPPNKFAGMDVLGSYNGGLIVQNYQIPAGYFVAAATAGRSSNLNLIGVREDERPELRGLVLVPGPNNTYPLRESYFVRGIGTGVAQRGAAAVMQIDAGSTYTVPASMAW